MSKRTLRWHGKLILLDPDQGSKVAEDWLRFAHNHVAGQPRLLDVVAQGLEKFTAGVRDPDKPIFGVLGLGPSGSGKTFVPQVLADFLFGSRDGLIRIDGQDFPSRHNVERLTGATPGYIGYEDEPVFTQEKLDRPAFNARKREFILNLPEEKKRALGALQERLRGLRTRLKGAASVPPGFAPIVTGPISEEIKRVQEEISQIGHPIYNPRIEKYLSIVLCDEIGRADKALHNLLFKILDEGRLETVSWGTVSFRNTFLFLTDNAGSLGIADKLRQMSGKEVQMGFHSGSGAAADAEADDHEIYKIAMKEARKVFETPFLNRMSQIVVARPLRREDLQRILEIKIRELHDLLVGQRCPMLIQISRGVRNFLVNEALDSPEENARLLVKKLESRVTQKLMRLILTDQIREGDCVVVTFNPSSVGKIRFQKIPHDGGEKQRLLVPPGA